jgi:hypothetical protein
VQALNHCPAVPAAAVTWPAPPPPCRTGACRTTGRTRRRRTSRRWPPGSSPARQVGPDQALGARARSSCSTCTRPAGRCVAGPLSARKAAYCSLVTSVASTQKLPARTSPAPRAPPGTPGRVRRQIPAPDRRRRAQVGGGPEPPDRRGIGGGGATSAGRSTPQSGRHQAVWRPHRAAGRPASARRRGLARGLNPHCMVRQHTLISVPGLATQAYPAGQSRFSWHSTPRG